MVNKKNSYACELNNLISAMMTTIILPKVTVRSHKACKTDFIDVGA